MDALKPFNSKLVALTIRGGFFTKFAALAHGAPSQIIGNLAKNDRPFGTYGDSGDFTLT